MTSHNKKPTNKTTPPMMIKAKCMKLTSFAKYIPLLLLGATVLYGQQYNLPSNLKPSGGWVAGADLPDFGGIPSYTGVTCTGLHDDGITDDGPGIKACLNALSSGQASLIPAGTNYFVNSVVRGKSNIALRGTSTSGTVLVLGASGRIDTQNFSFSGSIYPTTNFQTLPATCQLSGTPAAGDTTLTNSSTDPNCNLSVGMYISPYGNDNHALMTSTGEDGWCGYCAFNDGFYIAQQIVKVASFVSGTGGTGTVFTISRPLYLTPDVSTETVVGNGGTGTQTEPAGAKYTIINFTTTKFGIENITVSGASHDIGSNPIITLEGCLFCWIKGVETSTTGSSSNSSHVQLQVTYGADISGNYFHDQRSGASGSGYGIFTQWISSDGKIENNIVHHSRHSVLFQGGGSGFFIGYNYLDDGYTDDLTYFASSRSSHGGHPFMNLWEGNIMSHFTADEFIGSSSHNVLFRNWLRGGEPNFNLGAGTIPSFPPNGGFNAVDLYACQSDYSFVNNILGNNSSFPTLDNWSAATLTGYNRNSTNTNPLVYSVDPSTCTYGPTVSIPASSSTLIRQGNYDYKTLGIAFNDGGTCGSSCTYANSLYYASEPTFIGSCAWPAQGSDLTAKGTLQQAAYMRATGGSCSAPPPSPTSLSTILLLGN